MPGRLPATRSAANLAERFPPRRANGFARATARPGFGCWGAGDPGAFPEGGPGPEESFHCWLPGVAIQDRARSAEGRSCGLSPWHRWVKMRGDYSPVADG